MNKADIYQAVSDLIVDNYKWIEENPCSASSWMLGINDMARYLAEKCKDKPAPESKKPKKIDIDMGKVKALRTAGRTVEWIADDLGVSAQTIYNRLKEEGDKNEAN